jgi:hypothetical protein
MGGRSPFSQTDAMIGPLPIVYRGPEQHAEQLLKWWHQTGQPTGEVLSRNVQAGYGRMCIELGWQERAWNRVGACFRSLIGARKQYRDVVVNGRRHRWCTLRIPAKPAQRGLRADSFATRSRRSADSRAAETKMRKAA